MRTFLVFLLSVLLAALRRTPKGLFPLLATGVCVLARPFAGKDRRRLRSNARLIYGLPAGSHFSRMFERQVWRHQSICALETLRIIQDPDVAEVVGLEEVRASIAAAEVINKGHIIITAHLGSWELCALYGQKAATRPFHVLAKASRWPEVTAFLDRLRRRMGTPVLWTDKKSLLKDMLKALRGGESVGFVMDQKPEGRQGPKVEFLGQPTEFVSGPAQMAVKTGCAVISVFCMREGPFRYRLVSRTLAPGNHGETDEDALTQRMADAISSVIRAYPEQWTWNYKRWRDSSGGTQPPNARSSSNAAATVR